jgi:Transposase DDE domain group 1
VKRTSTRPALKVRADGKGIASHAGSRLLAEMADARGLTEALSVAMGPLSQRRRRHDPGRVVVDVAVMLADGGTSLSDLSTLRDQPALFGEVASDPTAFRVMDAINDAMLVRIRAARAAARKAVWAAGVRAVLDEHAYLTLDFDATLLTAHSEKESAAPTYKRGFGFHPLGCWLDGTNEALAVKLRAGNAGANDADDHIEVLNLALAQLPVAPKGIDPDNGVAMLARADSAGATHAFVNALRKYGIEFSVGYDITSSVRMAILELPERAWVEAIDQDCEAREGAGVAELTDDLDLSSWPEGTRAIVRREEPHPGAQFNLFDPNGWRHQVFICDSTDPDISYLEARHRGHARVEDHIRCGKDTGLRNLPFIDFAANAAWVECVLLAQDLIAWTQILTLDGPLSRAEPKRLRYTLLHAAGKLSKGGRQVTLHLSQDWPWARQLAAAFDALAALPLLA